MVAEAKRPGSITFLLAGLVLLVTVAGFAFFCIPLVKCPCCQGAGGHMKQVGISYGELHDCEACVGASVFRYEYFRGKFTLFNKLMQPVGMESWRRRDGEIHFEKFKPPDEKK